MYCSNCGVETTGKLCKACGVKQGVNNKFCKFCGKEIDPNCKKCPNCNENVKVSGIFKLINIIKYPAAIVFLFFSVIGFISIGPLRESGNMTKTIVCAVVIIVAVLLGLVVPIIITKKNNNNNKSRMISLPLIVVMIVVSSVCCKMMIAENASLNVSRDAATLNSIKSAVADGTIDGEAAFNSLIRTHDQVQKIMWYTHKNQPTYCGTNSYIYPYIGISEDGKHGIRIELNYTDAKTADEWLFFKKVTFSIDGENVYRTLDSDEVVRDSDTVAWETANFLASDDEIALLKRIANSEETIIRFDGAEYYTDYTVTEKEKIAIFEVLAAYEYLLNLSE